MYTRFSLVSDTWDILCTSFVKKLSVTLNYRLTRCVCLQAGYLTSIFSTLQLSPQANLPKQYW